MKTLIIIQSRMSAARLPGKPLLKINGKSIISHVFNILVFVISKRENLEEFNNCEEKIGSIETLYNSRL